MEVKFEPSISKDRMIMRTTKMSSKNLEQNELSQPTNITPNRFNMNLLKPSKIGQGPMSFLPKLAQFFHSSFFIHPTTSIDQNQKSSSGCQIRTLTLSLISSPSIVLIISLFPQILVGNSSPYPDKLRSIKS